MYDVGHLLGKGTFGSVIQVMEKGRKKKLTAKIFDNIFVIARELKILTWIQNNQNFPPHENILQFYEFLFIPESFGGVAKNIIIMEYVGTMNLSMWNKFRRDKKYVINPSVVYNLCSGIFSGLSHLHEQLGISHLDIKPENIVVREGTENTDNPVPVLVDFGVSCLERVSATEVGNCGNTENNGTLFFMSPERRNKCADTLQKKCTVKERHSTDVWAAMLTVWISVQPNDRLMKSLHEWYEKEGDKDRIRNDTSISGIRDIVLSGLEWDYNKRSTAVRIMNMLKEIKKK